MSEQTLPGSGRNLGVKYARGEIIVFNDSDSVPDSDWLSRIITRYQNEKTVSVGGCVINGYPKNIVAWINHLIEFNGWMPKVSLRKGVERTYFFYRERLAQYLRN